MDTPTGPHAHRYPSVRLSEWACVSLPAVVKIPAVSNVYSGMQHACKSLLKLHVRMYEFLFDEIVKKKKKRGGFTDRVDFHFFLFLELGRRTASILQLLIPVLPDVHATLHLLGRMDASARVSHRVRVSALAAGRLPTGPERPDGRSRYATTCASFPLVSFRSRTRGTLRLRSELPACVFPSTALRFLPLRSPW